MGYNNYRTTGFCNKGYCETHFKLKSRKISFFSQRTAVNDQCPGHCKTAVEFCRVAWSPRIWTWNEFRRDSYIATGRHEPSKVRCPKYSTLYNSWSAVQLCIFTCVSLSLIAIWWIAPGDPVLNRSLEIPKCFVTSQLSVVIKFGRISEIEFCRWSMWLTDKPSCIFL